MHVLMYLNNKYSEKEAGREQKGERVTHRGRVWRNTDVRVMSVVSLTQQHRE